MKGPLPLVFHPINFNSALAEPDRPEYVEGVRWIIAYSGARWVGQDVGVWMDGGN